MATDDLADRSRKRAPHGHAYDLLVLGAGSGGFRAARVAAAHGARVAVAEEHRVGGTCVIRGCIPKKLLVYGAHFAEDLADARRFGWIVPESKFDWSVLRANVLAEVDRLNGLYSETLLAGGVETLHQRAVVTGPNSARLADGTEVTAGVILVAVGARPSRPRVIGAEFGITSEDVFQLPSLPARVLIAGAGYIANEFAGIFREFGSAVTVVNRTDVILRGYEATIRDRLLQISTARGIDFRFHTAIDEIAREEDGSLRVSLAGHDPIVADCVLFATGRQPHTIGLGLESAGVELDEAGAVRVDEDSRTTCPSVFAVGDVTNRVQLTPVAILEGQAFADTHFGGKPTRVDYSCIPSAVFSNPPMAGVGLTEAAARDRFGAVKVYVSDFRPMKNVLAQRDERAIYKLVCEPETERILGIHMIGPEAPEILQAAAIAVTAGLTKAQFDATVALHPTMAEELVLMR